MRGWNVYNLGSGDGTSVREMMSIFEFANDKKIWSSIVDRRPGDFGEVVACIDKAYDELEW